MSSDEPLFVIDCQEYFLSEIKNNLRTSSGKLIPGAVRQFIYYKFISNVCDTVTKAMKENRWIVIAEFDLKKSKYWTSEDFNGIPEKDIHTTEAINYILTGYAKVHRVNKLDNSVWEFLGDFMPSIGNPRSVSVCGVNLDACVMESIMDFTNNGIRVKVIEKATRNCNTNYNVKKFLSMAGFANANLIETVKSL